MLNPLKFLILNSKADLLHDALLQPPSGFETPSFLITSSKMNIRIYFSKNSWLSLLPIGREKSGSGSEDIYRAVYHQGQTDVLDSHFCLLILFASICGPGSHSFIHQPVFSLILLRISKYVFPDNPELRQPCLRTKPEGQKALRTGMA
jgi:hypothetical protein